jgi:hypothetical protein
MVDALDSKSSILTGVTVRVRPSAPISSTPPKKTQTIVNISFFQLFLHS